MDFPFSKLLMVCLVSPIRSPNSCVVQPQIFRNINKFSLEEEPDEVDVRILHRRIADQRIINAVTWYKVQHTQLFISNDKALLGGNCYCRSDGSSSREASLRDQPI